MDFENYIELFDIQKSYGKDIALKVNYYKIPLDGIVTIVGFSGNGKTTLLNIIGLLDIPDLRLNTKIIYKIDGQKYFIRYKNSEILVYLDENSSKRLDLNKFRQKFLSFVFQESLLHPSLDTENNVLMPLKIRDKNYSGNINTLFEEIGINENNSKSGGQKQRTAILRSLIKKSSIIFADEPTSSLDKPRAIQALKAFQSTNTIWVTHDMLLAQEFSKYIIVVDKGRLCELKNSSDGVNILQELKKGCGEQKSEELKNIVVANSKKLTSFEKLSFILQYAKNDLFKPLIDFGILWIVGLVSFLTLLFIFKVDYSLDKIIEDRLNDPKVSFIQIAGANAQTFSDKDFEIFKKNVFEKYGFVNRCIISKIKRYPNMRFEKKDGTYTNMSIGTFQGDSLLFKKLIKDNDIKNPLNIDIQKKLIDDDPNTIEEELSFVIIGKNAQDRHNIKGQKVTKLGDINMDINILYAKDKLPLDQSLFVREEFFLELFGADEEPKDFSIIIIPKDIKTSLEILELLKKEKNKTDLANIEFFITDEANKFNSLRLITTIKDIITFTMKTIIPMIIFLLFIIACANIWNNIEQKRKELGVMLSFGIFKSYFFIFYVVKALFFTTILILSSFTVFHLLQERLNNYLRDELFSSILAFANGSSNVNIVLNNFPLSIEWVLYLKGTVVILSIFIGIVAIILFRTHPSKLLR